MGSGLGHWSAWRPARVEVKQQEEAKEREKADPAGEIVKSIVERTNVEPQPRGIEGS